jgi:hypothetical protein
MLKRVWKVVHPVFTLVAVGCCVYLLVRPSAQPQEAGQPFEPRDAELRALLKVRTLESHYSLPSGEDHCGVLLMRFEDGRNIGPFTGTTFSVGEDGSRRVPFQFLCGKTSHGVRALVNSPKWGFTSGDDFFDDLDGGPSGWWGGGGNSGLGELDGCRVIAFASSRECRPGHEAFQNSSGKDTADLIEKRKRVLALVVKPFPTEDDARRWVEDELIRSHP